jgi:hypothetical protein
MSTIAVIIESLVEDRRQEAGAIAGSGPEVLYFDTAVSAARRTNNTVSAGLRLRHVA